MTWMRIVRREAAELVTRQRMAGPDARMMETPIPGAELLCPACSSEARPDEGDTATCGSCGTLSPLEATIAFSNFVHQALHFGVRVRVAILEGKGGAEVPHVSRPFPRILVRVGSLIVLAAVSGMRRSQLEELLTQQKPLLSRWVQKEVEEGSRSLAQRIPANATGMEMAHEVLEATLGPLPSGFPDHDSVPFTLEQVFHATAQYYKFRTASIYGAMFSDALAFGVRARMDAGVLDPIPWKEAQPLARALDPAVRNDTRDRYRAGEEALTRAALEYLENNLRLVRGVFGRHRVTARLTTTT